MSAPAFLIPSIVWYGLAPAQPSVAAAAGTPALSGWGGRIGSDAAVPPILKTIDPVLLLLNLAGYQVPEVAIGIPSSGSETGAGDLIAVDLRVMTYGRGTKRAWTPLGSSSAQVALWVEPRFPIAPPEHATGPTLLLLAVGDAVGASIDLDFATTGTGWVRLSWPASAGDDWGTALIGLVDSLTDPLVREVENQAATAAETDDGSAAPLCGLLGLYDVRTWRTPIPWPPEAPTSPAVAEFGSNLVDVIQATGLASFLTDELADVPPSVRERWFLATWVDPGDVGDELQRQARDRPLSEQKRLALSDTARPGFPDLTVTQLLLYGQELGVLDFLTAISEQVAEVYGGELYGGKALTRGDQGEDVAQLRRDLATLGFGPLFLYDPAETGPQTFDWDLEFAVRELQGYAKMPSLAQEVPDAPGDFYADRLVQVPNPALYAGPVSGVVNADTRALIFAWLSAELRCPVVVEARRTADGGKCTLEDTVTDNLWRSQQLTQEGTVVQMYARDFTGHWTLLPENVTQRRSLTEVLIGKWREGGPVALSPTHVWVPEDEITPETFVGKPVAALTAGERSTFRVIRATAEIESGGYFDEINAWDSDYISVGPCQWTFGHTVGSADIADSELPAYFSYLESEEPATYEAAYATFGCGVTKAFADIKVGQAKYACWVTLQNEAGGFEEAPRADPHVVGEWFRDWHWFTRLSMAARTIEPFRMRMWDSRACGCATSSTSRTRWAAIRTGSASSSRRRRRSPSSCAGTSSARAASCGTSTRCSPAPKAGVHRTRGETRRQDTLCTRLLAEGCADQVKLGLTMKEVDGWGDPASADWTHKPHWALDYDGLINRPGRTEALVTAKDTPVEAAIDWRDVIGNTRVLESPLSSDQSVVAASGLVVGSGRQLTITPVPGATGTTTITVTADNGAHVATSAFNLVVGGGDPPEPSPPQPGGGTTGLSTRRNSFLSAFEGLK